MTERTARVLRALTVAVFVAVVAAGAVAGWRTLTPGPEVHTPEPGPGELAVSRAIDVATTDAVTVRGYVFVGPGGLGLRLCEGIRRGDPPRCQGPFLDLDRVDEGFFDLDEGEADAGRVKWMADPVALRGSIRGTRMTVDQVLR